MTPEEWWKKSVQEVTDSYTKKLAQAVDLLKNIRDNYDCDGDAHKYKTACRSCDARELLKEWGIE